jgi:hypothetical protein
VRDRIHEFITGSLARAPAAGDVECQALALFRWQRDHNPSYAAFCGGVEPGSAAEIPAVPVGLFRDLPLCCFDPQAARHRFHTSGTTTGNPGVHRLLDCDTYDLASVGWFRALFPDAPTRCVSLIPSPADAPRSSLSHMIGLLYPQARWLADADGLVPGSVAWRVLAAQEQPVFLACTALALAALLDAPGRALLPQGSLLMTTGGFKGRSLQVDPAQLLEHASERLGGAVAVLGEYGMTELCSQLWSLPSQPALVGVPAAQGPFLPPPWLLPMVVDPGNGRSLPVGATGQIRFVDLANDHSVLAIETMDQGTLLPGGSLLLHGRLPGAQARGCSLSVEEALRASRGR